MQYVFKRILCVLIGFLVVCSAFAICDPWNMSKLQGKWVLESLNGQPIKSENEIYFKIEGNVITGFDGCNKFGGNLDEPFRLRMSQRDCVSHGPRLPLELPDPRTQLESAVINGSKLILPLSGDAGEASFSLQK